jgi:hypothetical protein
VQSKAGMQWYSKSYSKVHNGNKIRKREEPIIRHLTIELEVRKQKGENEKMKELLYIL